MPRHTFSAVLGAVTAAGRNNAETFQYFRPGFDLAVERERREAAGLGEAYTEEDLYPDVRPALAALREMGLWVGIAGNQTAKAGRGDPFVSRTRYPGLGHYVVGTGSEQAPDRHVANLDPARGCRWPEPRGKLGLGRSGAGGAAGARPDPGPARVRQAAGRANNAGRGCSPDPRRPCNGRALARAGDGRAGTIAPRPRDRPGTPDRGTGSSPGRYPGQGLGPGNPGTGWSSKLG